MVRGAHPRTTISFSSYHRPLPDSASVSPGASIIHPQPPCQRLLFGTDHGDFTYFEWVFEKLMHNPGPKELEALLPVHWIKTQESASQTIEVQIA